MEIELDTNQAFDEYAARFGWEYDNGGQYGGLACDWYASNAHRWGRRGGPSHEMLGLISR